MVRRGEDQPTRPIPSRDPEAPLPESGRRPAPHAAATHGQLPRPACATRCRRAT